MEQISSYTSCDKSASVCGRGPGPLPSFLRYPPLDPACPSMWPLLFKIFVSSPLFFVTNPPFKVFQTVPCHPHETPFCHNLTHQLSLEIINRFKEISKESSSQFNCRFLSKINLWFFISFYKYISLSYSMRYSQVHF